MEEIKAFVRSRQPVNFLIVCINILVFLVFSLTGNTQDTLFMLNHGASYAPYITENGEYYRLVTSMFLHFGVEHLVYNMLLLIFVGDMLEKYVGKIKFIVIYLLGGISGNLLAMYFDLQRYNHHVSAGASGAIFAVIGALIWIVIRHRGVLEGYSTQRLVFMAVLSIAEGFTTTGVDNMAHIGGLAAGFILCVLLYRKKEARY